MFLFRLIKKMGLLRGVLTWKKCRQRHHWMSVGPLYPMLEGPLLRETEYGNEPVGRWYECKAKMVCKRCQSGKLEDMEIHCYMDGHREAFSKSGEPIEFV